MSIRPLHCLVVGVAALLWPATARPEADPRPVAPAGRQLLEVEIGGRPIPVVVLAPTDPPGEHGHPLVVSLHGQSVDGGRECDHNWGAQRGVVIACPTEPNAPWRDTWGERVALDTAGEMVRRYRIDPDRVFLSGASTGGIGAWRIALRRPDRFAGVIPRAGMPPLWNDALLSNLLAMGVYVVHGANDHTIVPDADRRAAERLHELGGAVIHRELDGAHSAFPAESAAIAAWLQRRRRDPAPRSFRYAIGRNLAPLPGRVHWLELSGRVGLPIALSASIDRAAGRVELQFTEGYAENVRVLLDARLVDLSRSVTVMVNGEERFRGSVPAPEPGLAARLEEETGDPGVAFDRAIALELDVPEPARASAAPARRRPHARRAIHRPRRRHRVRR